MNYILSKPEENTIFTKFEIEAMSRIDFNDKTLVKWCKFIWDNKDDEEKLNEILKLLKEEQNNGNTSINNSEKVVVENQQA